MDEPCPTRDRAEDWVPAFVHEQVTKGISVQEIEIKLVERGLDKHTAAAVSRNVLQMRSPIIEQHGGKKILLGAFVSICGLALTLASYTAAAPEGTYVVAVGAILGGCLLFLAGLAQVVQSP